MSKWKRLFIEVIKVKYKVRLHCGAQAAAGSDYGAQQQTDLLDFVRIYRKSHVFLHCQQRWQKKLLDAICSQSRYF